MINIKPGKTNNLPYGVDFTWYRLGRYGDLVSTEYPQYQLDQFVLQLPVTIIRSTDYNGMDIPGVSCLTVSFNGVYIPLGQDGYYPYCKAHLGSYYAVTMMGGYVYLGVQS